eukprot:7382397-Prymnesium_polylepis.1
MHSVRAPALPQIAPPRVCPVGRLRATQPIPTTCRLAVAFQLSGPGDRLPIGRQVKPYAKSNTNEPIWLFS